MKVKRILITVESPGFQPLNRFSAVASVIYSFAELLNKNGYEVYINDQAVAELKNKQAADDSGAGITKAKSVYRFVPKRGREIIKDILKFRALKTLNTQLSAVPRPDVIIAWISYGS